MTAPPIESQTHLGDCLKSLHMTSEDTETRSQKDFSLQNEYAWRLRAIWDNTYRKAFNWCEMQCLKSSPTLFILTGHTWRNKANQASL